VAPRLKGDRAPYAAFQGARALARIDRMDEAIAASLRVVERYPGSRWAAEAQFVAGWLEFNRGRYADCLAPLRTTLDRDGRSGFAAGAAWYLALAHHFLGHRDEALTALETYARLSGADPDSARRASYWRAPLPGGQGQHDRGEGAVARPGPARAALVLRDAGARAPARGRGGGGRGAAQAPRQRRPRRRARW
jgi:tetratricopeptide (TPR) repeat protein